MRSLDIANMALTGGIFAVLALWHFFADWTFQSHKEALAKSKNHLVRAWHCTVYVLLFLPLFLFVGFTWSAMWGCLALLWISHFIIDTYIPVMLWAKYIRQAPQFANVVTPEERKLLQEHKGWQDKVVDLVVYNSDEEAFKAFFSTNIGAILCITMDQFLHLVFLLPVAWIMLH